MCMPDAGGSSAGKNGIAIRLSCCKKAASRQQPHKLPMQVRELDLSTMEWRRVETKGQSPPFRLHSSAAVVSDKWIIHGGRRAGKFNITNDTFVFDFNTLRQAAAGSGKCQFPTLYRRHPHVKDLVQG